MQALTQIAPGEFALNFTVVYEDVHTRQWAGEVCERLGRLVGSDAVRKSWWKLDDFNEPAVLAGAVSTALRADVLVIAIHGAEVLPLPFYVWVESWLPHRGSRLAALLALVGLPGRPRLASDSAQDYLRAVAQEAHLDFLLEERKLPASPAEAPRETERCMPARPDGSAAALKKGRNEFEFELDPAA